jgi:dihydrofolate reductase
MGYGAQHAARPPFFVVTHQPPADVRLKLDFRFVADVPTAIEQAKAVAGDKDVFVMGGGQIIRQSVDAGLVDELVLHLSPVVLGAGTPLFVDAARRELVQREVRPSRTAVHLTYDVR